MRMILLATLLIAQVMTPGCRSCNMTHDSDLSRAKEIMIDFHLKQRGIKNSDVLAAMRTVPRELFVDKAMRPYAYDDNPLPIGEGQTISQPYIVALMTELLKPEKTDNALEVGTGSGYQAAVLSLLVNHIYTIEIKDSLARETAERLQRLRYDNVTAKAGDGYAGWQEHAPFDKIIVTAAADIIPTPLIEQLKEGGLIIMPVGQSSVQELVLGTKKDGKMTYKNITAVRFVPMTGVVERH